MIWLGLVIVLSVLFGISRLEVTNLKVELISLRAADASALATLRKKADDKSAQLQRQAEQAKAYHDQVQASFDAYVATHAVPVTRVCHDTNGRRGSLPKTAPGNATDAGNTPGPTGLSGLPQSVAGPDISPNLDLIVRAAAAVSGYLRQYQMTHANGT